MIFDFTGFLEKSFITKKTSFSEFWVIRRHISVGHIIFVLWFFTYFFISCCCFSFSYLSHISILYLLKNIFHKYVFRKRESFTPFTSFFFFTTRPFRRAFFESLDMQVRWEREGGMREIYMKEKKEKLLYGLETSVQKITFFIFFITLPKFLSFFFDSQAI